MKRVAEVVKNFFSPAPIPDDIVKKLNNPEIGHILCHPLFAGSFTHGGFSNAFKDALRSHCARCRTVVDDIVDDCVDALWSHVDDIVDALWSDADLWVGGSESYGLANRSCLCRIFGLYSAYRIHL